MLHTYACISRRFFSCITKCKKMMFMSVWNRTHTCSGVRFRKQSKCSNGFHSVKTAEKKVYKHCVRHWDEHLRLRGCTFSNLLSQQIMMLTLYIAQYSSSKLFIPLSATFIWTCRFNLLHTDITFRHFFTVSLLAQNLPFQKILSFPP